MSVETERARKTVQRIKRVESLKHTTRVESLKHTTRATSVT